MEDKELLKLAEAARANAYAPYSNFLVGAALLTEDGKVYTGCNIENASYGATVCAERTAIFKAVSEGAECITAIAISGGEEGSAGDVCPPCGICRQVMAEFCRKDCKIILGNAEHCKVYTLSELLPLSFALPD